MARKLYMQIYDYYKNLIESGKITEGTKIPSIRRCSEETGVSKTTVEQAYMCLCDDGYILPKSQSGYYVSKRVSLINRNNEDNDVSEETKSVLYDFSSSGVDIESFDMDVWRRYVKSALRQTERLLFYGEPQGEIELRREIAKYARDSRNCVCSEENIVIGAGVQTLLGILCPLLKPRKKVSFDDISYKQGTAIFRDYGFNITTDRNQSDIIYTSPSFSSRWGDTMHINERFALVDYARQNSKIIIEDDYGSEFRYFNKPTPSLQGLDGGENTVYIGTFSKLLLPSIRISFMILPTSLLKEYKKKRNLYNQTVSKAEQIALCSYIRDGHINSQIRKSRKLYTQKSKTLTDIITEEFKENAEVFKTDSPLYIRCRFAVNMTTEEFCKKAENSGISLIAVISENEYPEVAFSVTSVSSENMQTAVKLLKKAVTSCQ